jgi:hypothetical protein
MRGAHVYGIHEHVSYKTAESVRYNSHKWHRRMEMLRDCYDKLSTEVGAGAVSEGALTVNRFYPETGSSG